MKSLTIPRSLSDKIWDHGATAIKVQCSYLEFKLGNIEPYFCKMTIFDLDSATRTSEDFFFDMNSSDTLLLLNPIWKPPDIVTQIRSAIFYILPEQTTKKLFLVLEISKVLQGDGDLATTPYCNPEKYSTDVEQEKLKQKAKENCLRMGRYRQTLAWGAIPLHDLLANGTSSYVDADNPIQVQLYRQKTSVTDEQRIASLIEASRGSLKEKVIPAQCKIHIEELSERTLSTFHKADNLDLPSDSTLLVTDPFLNSSHDHEIPSCLKSNDTISNDMLIREVQPFSHGLNSSGLGPASTGPTATAYFNTLYLYPRELERFQHRNIAIRVQLFSQPVPVIGGSICGGSALSCIYNNKVGSALTTEAITQVTYHQKTPHLGDEIKIRLPLHLTSTHHILFTFYHVHCKKIEKGAAQELTIGYSVLPLMTSLHIVKDGKYSLAVYLDGFLPSDYLSSTSPEQSRLNFSCSTKLLSSIYSLDESITDFFSCQNPLQSMEKLSKSKPSAIRFHLLGILRQLWEYLLLPKWKDLRQVAFTTLLDVFDKASIGSNGGRVDLTHAYAEFIFDDTVFNETKVSPEEGVHSVSNELSNSNFNSNDGDEKNHHQRFWPFAHEVLTFKWMDLLRESTPTLQQLSMRHSNVLFQVILKSLALKNMKKTPADLTVGFERSLCGLIEALVQRIGDVNIGLILRKDLNINIAIFLRKLFLLAKINHVSRLVNHYFKLILQFPDQGEMLNNMTFPFIRVLVDFDHFVHVNKIKPIPFVCTTTKTHENSDPRPHWLAELLFQTLLTVISNQLEEKLRSEALGLLRRLFTIHSYDNRYQSRSARERIALMYLPMIDSALSLVSSWDNLENKDTMSTLSSHGNHVRGHITYSRQERREFLVCLAFIIQNSPIRFLRRLWRNRLNSAEISKNSFVNSSRENPVLLNLQKIMNERKAKLGRHHSSTGFSTLTIGATTSAGTGFPTTSTGTGFPTTTTTTTATQTLSTGSSPKMTLSRFQSLRDKISPSLSTSYDSKEQKFACMDRRSLTLSPKSASLLIAEKSQSETLDAQVHFLSLLEHFIMNFELPEQTDIQPWNLLSPESRPESSSTHTSISKIEALVKERSSRDRRRSAATQYATLSSRSGIVSPQLTNYHRPSMKDFSTTTSNSVQHRSLPRNWSNMNKKLDFVPNVDAETAEDLQEKIKSLCEDICIIVLDTTEEFIDEFDQFFKKPGNQFHYKTRVLVNNASSSSSSFMPQSPKVVPLKISKITSPRNGVTTTSPVVRKSVTGSLTADSAIGAAAGSATASAAGSSAESTAALAAGSTAESTTAPATGSTVESTTALAEGSTAESTTAPATTPGDDGHAPTTPRDNDAVVRSGIRMGTGTGTGRRPTSPSTDPSPGYATPRAKDDDDLLLIHHNKVDHVMNSAIKSMDDISFTTKKIERKESNDETVVLEILSRILKLFYQILTCRQSDVVMSKLFRCLSSFLEKYQATLFALKSNETGIMLMHSEDWCKELLRHGVRHRECCRRNASNLLYELIEANFLQVGSITRMRTSLVSVYRSILGSELSSLTDSSQVMIESNFLRMTLQEIVAFSSSNDLLKTHIEDLSQFLSKQLRCWQLLEQIRDAQRSNDATVVLPLNYESLQEDIWEIIQSISDSWLPLVKAEWYEDLYELHLFRKNLPEAAQCKLQQAKTLQLCYGGQSKEYLTCLKTALTNFKQAGIYPGALEVLQKIAKIYEKLGEHRELAHSYEEMGKMALEIARQKNGVNPPDIGTYFKVICYGNLLDEDKIQGVEYIYKEPTYTSLGEFMTRIKGIIESSTSCRKLELIPESKRISSIPMDRDVIYMQLTSVEPLAEDIRSFQKFSYSIPFTISGASYGKTSEQFKKTTILDIQHPFPHCITRQQVIRKQETVLTPIESTIEDVNRRTVLLHQEIEKNKNGSSDLKTLTHILKGSVDTHVHGGIPEVVEAFLRDEDEPLLTLNGKMPQYDAQRHRKALKTSITQFLQLCLKVLLISREAFRQQNLALGHYTVDAEVSPLQTEFERGYIQMVDSVSPFLGDSLGASTLQSNMNVQLKTKITF